MAARLSPECPSSAPGPAPAAAAVARLLVSDFVGSAVLFCGTTPPALRLRLRSVLSVEPSHLVLSFCAQERKKFISEAACFLFTRVSQVKLVASFRYG